MTRARGRTSVIALAALLVATGCALDPIDLSGVRPLALRTTITASDGSVLARIFEPNANRALVPMRNVPRDLRNAVLAAEDARFFEHSGYDIRSIARAALTNLREGKVVQGGSTITQQYVKNAYFRRPRRTFERKARELRLAIEVERRYTKREILERYLNTVYLGQGAYGVKAAGETYFATDVSALTLADSALLAAVIKAPSYYDPRARPRNALARRNYVLDRMVDLGMIDGSDAARVRKAGLGITRRSPQPSIREPYFVEAVKRELLADRRLGDESERAAALYRGGLRVTTTLRPRLQRAAEAAVRRVLFAPGDPAAALVAIEPSTGRIVAMVGGRDWNASQVNLALGRAGGGSGRQAGSSFKPIVAAAAMEAGISLDETYESAPAAFRLDEDDYWVVRNSEGTGSGSLSISEAMVRSVNAVFARLMLQLGIDRVRGQAELMGVRSPLPSAPAIALGAGEVSVLDMAAAYATLANNGTAVEPTTIEEVRIPGGGGLRPEQESTLSAVSPGNAYLLTKTLQQVIVRGTGRAAVIGRPAAGKTGTTDDYADAWFAGYTPQLAVAVWVGYPRGRVPMTNVHGITVYGGTFPAAIWREFMVAAHRRLPVKDFRPPPGEIVKVEIDPVTGLLAAPWCPGEVRKMLRQFVPAETCPAPPSPTVSPEDPGREATPTPRPIDRANREDKSNDEKPEDEETKKKEKGKKAKR